MFVPCFSWKYYACPRESFTSSLKLYNSPDVGNLYTSCAVSLAAQCIVFGPECLFVCLFVGLCVCLCVYGSVTTITRNCVHRSSPSWPVGEVTISSWLNFGCPASPGIRGLRRGENFWLRLTTASAQCLRLSERFFILSVFFFFWFWWLE